MEFADIEELKNTNSPNQVDNDILKHYNPNRLPHGCPSVNGDDSTYHQGDFVINILF